MYREYLEVNAPVVATNDNDAVTGNQSSKWENITFTAVGVRGNVAAGNGLATAGRIIENKTKSTIDKEIAVKLPALIAATDNYIIIKGVDAGFSRQIDDPKAYVTGIKTDTDILCNRDVLNKITISYKEEEREFVIKIPNAQVAGVTGRIIYIMFNYR